MRPGEVTVRTLSFVSRAAAVCGIALMVLACGQGSPPEQVAAPAVTVVKVTAEDIRPMSTFTGRIEAMYKVDLRARVDGFLEKRLFTEGSNVKEGDLLFVIEKGLYQAAVDEAQAGVEKAEAALTLGDIEVDRQTGLVQKNVAAQAKLDEVTAKRGEAHGAMLAEKAALEKAKLQLGYTDIRAPISGRIGRAPISVGNYVTAASNALATIVSQDPIYVNFPVTQRELLAFLSQHGGKEAARESTIYVRLADGTRYAQPGKINFLDVTVNQGTDTVQVRATFPNPDGLLIDGALVAVVAEHGAGDSALLVPQQALQADQAGSYVLVVDRDNKVQVRRIETGGARGTQMVVRKGLTADDRVITEGIQKVRPGQVVQAAEVKPEA
jgi:membrane fusion protein, multidrug efflux system